MIGNLFFAFFRDILRAARVWGHYCGEHSDSKESRDAIAKFSSVTPKDTCLFTKLLPCGMETAMHATRKQSVCRRVPLCCVWSSREARHTTWCPTALKFQWLLMYRQGLHCRLRSMCMQWSTAAYCKMHRFLLWAPPSLDQIGMRSLSEQ